MVVVESDKAHIEGILTTIIVGKTRLALWDSFVYGTHFQIYNNEGFVVWFFQNFEFFRFFLCIY